MGDNRSSMRQLPAATVRLIASSQVITSVVSVIKELVENSLDANSSSIEIKLENYGFDKIEVRDNGDGIKPSDTPYMAQPHYTSKITSSEDLQHLTSYGFRGEALGSLCAVSRLSITTKTSEDPVGMTYDLNFNGQIVSSKPTHLGQGTTLTATDLFKNLPVRRQFYSILKKRKEELKKVEDLVVAFSIIRHNVRFVLRHNKDTIWMKNPVAGPRDVLIRVFGSPVMTNMQHARRQQQDTEIDLDIYIPQTGADSHLTSRTSTEKCFIFVNKRPVIMKDLEKILKKYYCNAMKCDARYPLAYLALTVPPDAVDVNVDPNKTKVMIHEKSELLNLLGEVLSEVYGPLEKKVADKKNKVCDSSQGDCDSDLPSLTGLDHATEDDSVNNEKDKENVSTGAELKITYFGSDQMEKSVVEPTSCEKGQMDLNPQSAEKELSLEEVSEVAAPTKVKAQDSDISASILTQNAFDLLTDEIATSTPLDSLPGHQNDDNENKGQRSLNDTPLFDLSDKSLSAAADCDAEFERLAADLLANMDHDDFDMTIGQSAQVQHTASASVPPVAGGSDLSTGDSIVLAESNAGSAVDEKKESGGQSWSLGTSVKQADGKPAQPVSVLQPITSFLSPGPSSTSSREASPAPAAPLQHTPQHKGSQKRVTESPGQATLYDVMGSQPLKRPSSAFIHFAKAIRPQVFKDHSGASFNEVARIVGDRWKALSSEERHQYEELTNKEKERYQARLAAEVKAGNQPSAKPASASKRRKLSGGGSCEEKNGQETSLDEVVAERKSKNLSFSLDVLKNMFDKIGSVSDMSPNELNLIGTLKSHDVWLGSHDNHIMLLHPARAQEMIIYRRLLSQHALPIESVENNIVLQPSLVGGDDSWELLQQLTQSKPNGPDPFTYITDDRLIKNGFKLRMRKDPSDGRVHMEVTGLTRCLSFFGLHDLQEVLSMIQKDRNMTLDGCRPVKVKHYLQGEAVRMARKLPQSVSHQEVQDIHRQIMRKLSNEANRSLLTALERD